MEEGGRETGLTDILRLAAPGQPADSPAWWTGPAAPPARQEEQRTRSPNASSVQAQEVILPVVRASRRYAQRRRYGVNRGLAGRMKKPSLQGLGATRARGNVGLFPTKSSLLGCGPTAREAGDFRASGNPLWCEPLKQHTHSTTRTEPEETAYGTDCASAKSQGGGPRGGFCQEPTSSGGEQVLGSTTPV